MTRNDAVSHNTVPIDNATTGARSTTFWLFFFGSLGGILSGYNLGAIGGAILFIRREFALSPLLQGIVVSTVMFGAIFGSINAGRIADKIGRRTLLLWIGGIFTVGTIGSVFAVNTAMLIAFRLVIGFAVGGVSATVSLYLAEMAPTRVRGARSGLNILMIVSGILIAAIVGYALAGQQSWRAMIAIGLIPAVALTVGMFFQPETPRWLVLKGRTEEARAVLRRIHHTEAVEEELHAIQVSEKVVAGQSSGFGALFAKKTRAIFFVAVGLAAFQPLVGVNVIINYTPTTLVSVGFGAAAAILASVAVGVVNVLATIVAISVLDRFGRKPMLRIGSVGIVLCTAGIALAHAIPGITKSDAGVITLVCLLAFIAFYATSWGPSVYVLLPELFPARIRGIGVGFGFFVFWVADLAVTLAYPNMLHGLGPTGAFAIFTVIGLGANVFVHFKVIETRGRSLEQLQTDLFG